MQWSQCVVGAQRIWAEGTHRVYAGDDAIFYCSSYVDRVVKSAESLAWYFKPSSSGKEVIIASGLWLNDPRSTKYSLQARPDNKQGQPTVWYILYVHNVDFSDAGEYICRVGITTEDDDDEPTPLELYVPFTVLKLPKKQGKHSHYDSVQVGQ